MNYWLKAQNEFAIHSPFVFDLYTNVIQSNQQYYAFFEIENQRKRLLKNAHTIEIQDFGAGSRVFDSTQRQVNKIVHYSAINKAQGQLLFKLVNRFQPEYILELGTSLGLSTLYLSKAKSSAKVHTFEGCEETARLAQELFQISAAHNITMVTGKLEDTLQNTIKALPAVDFVFFDANHRLAPTLEYFEICLQKSHSDSIFVFDDIYWSSEMQQAWNAIKKHPEVTLTLDLFKLGLVFFSDKFEKQHFTLRF
ncbi:MAG: class I SAM-dependent methyltransferase [Microscillaceae bacterium]|nr:class I SAM-dependent methyltransferase [Microscillaceae bacterium]